MCLMEPLDSEQTGKDKAKPGVLGSPNLFYPEYLHFFSVLYIVFCLERVQIIQNIFFHMGVIFVSLFLAVPRSLRDLSFLARDQTQVPYIGSVTS